MAVTGAITNVLELRRLSPRHYAANAEAAFVHLRAKLRTEAAESVGLIFVTAGMGATVWALPRNWPYFTNLMGGYLAVSLLIALVIVPREARETEALVAVLLAESEGADVSDSATNFS